LKGSFVLIWDVDGVLLRTFDKEGGFIWSKTIEDDIGLPRPVVEDIFHGAWNDALIGHAKEEAIVADVFARHNVNLDPHVFLNYWMAKDFLPQEELLSLLSPQLSCLATNQTPLRASRIKAFFSDKVRHVFVSCDMGVMKPEPAYFMQIERELSLPPHGLTLIDDTPENIAAAQKCGWKTHLYTTTGDLFRFLQNA
jgi:putative hydrolase of the HAD superfamily